VAEIGKRYRHYKGTTIEVVAIIELHVVEYSKDELLAHADFQGLAKVTDDCLKHEPIVIYSHTKDGGLYARPLRVFDMKVEVPRFEEIR
jgi:hypothetical protein